MLNSMSITERDFAFLNWQRRFAFAAEEETTFYFLSYKFQNSFTVAGPCYPALGFRSLPMSDEPRLYINCMEEVRDRVNLVRSVGEHRTTTSREVFDVELVFVQFRKVLELIAFASLTANKEKYSTAHAKFATHWKANLMLRELEKINPDFYPMPVRQPELRHDGVKHCPAVTDGFLTKEDFVLLYDKTGDILHVQNPFKAQAPRIEIKYSVKEWVSRIQALLALHIMHLVDDKKWIVEIPESGAIRLWGAEPHTPGVT
jgi:hypothetical protein